MVAQGLAGLEQTQQVALAHSSACAASMGRMGDLVQVATDRGQLTGGLADRSQLGLWKRRQGPQMSAEQNGGIGRRRQTTGSRACLEQLSIAAREAHIETRLACRSISTSDTSIGSITDIRRTSGLQHENKHALEQRGLC